jgi:hypothetical protein
LNPFQKNKADWNIDVKEIDGTGFGRKITE